MATLVLAAARGLVQFLALFNIPVIPDNNIGTTVFDIGFEPQSLKHNGATRNFLEYTPQSSAPHANINNASLLITFHGLTSNSWIDYEPGIPTFLDLVDHADERGFILVAPEAERASVFGIPLFFRGWNDYGRWWLQPRAGVDDVGFTESLIDWAVAERGVSTDRVFVAGVGGTFVYRLLNERSRLFAAVSVLTASYQQEDKVAPPEGYVPTPLISIIGTRDPWFPYDGGSSLAFDIRSMDATRSFFAGLNGLMTSSRLETTILDTDSCRVDEIKYESGTAPVVSYTVEGGGHLSPGTDFFSLYAPLIRLQFGPLVCVEEFAFIPKMVNFFERFGL